MSRRTSRTLLPEGGSGVSRAPELRSDVVFTVQDVLADPPFSRLDLMSCRNLLIYLGPEAQAKLVSLFHFALRDGGILHARQVGVGRRRNRTFRAALEVASAVPAHRTQPPGRVRVLGEARGKAALCRATGSTAPADPPGRARRAVPQTGSGALCAVGRRARRRQARVPLHARIERSLPAGRSRLSEPRHSLHGAAWPAGSPAVGDRAGGARGSARHRAGRPDRTRWARRRLQHRGPARAERGRATVPRLLHRPACSRKRVRDEPGGAPADVARALELERELDATKLELQAAIRDLEVSTEEQKAINEEALSVNEEYQSTNEELLTSKEELQSLNEELTALNSQLQETLERQRTTSNDLQNVLYSTDVATLFLDTALNIRFFTPATQAAVQRHPGRCRPAARRPHAARGRPDAPVGRRDGAGDGSADRARDRGAERRLVRPPDPALPQRRKAGSKASSSHSPTSPIAGRRRRRCATAKQRGGAWPMRRNRASSPRPATICASRCRR